MRLPLAPFRSTLRLLAGVSLLLAAEPVLLADATLHTDAFDRSLEQWVVEQQPGGSVAVRDGALVIDDAAGATVWFRSKLTAPVVISYEVRFVLNGGPRQRLSDLNCFWMASDPRARGDFFDPTIGRTGAFPTYDGLRTYYVGMGGNTNTTTRFRRYDGSGARPLLPEHDLSASADLLKAGETYRIRLEALADGTVRYFANDRLIFDWKDPNPLKEGYFGFRTVWSHQEIRNFRVERPGP